MRCIRGIIMNIAFKLGPFTLAAGINKTHSTVGTVVGIQWFAPWSFRIDIQPLLPLNLYMKVSKR